MKTSLEKQALAFHKRLRGKITVQPKIPLKTKEQLKLIYTPGVGAVCEEIYQHHTTRMYTGKGNSVAIVTDGSKVLGLGNLGPEAALPVMEGKAVIFKQFANIDAYPLCLATQDTEEIIKIVKAIAPSFGAVNLEDISAPRCFTIENHLQNIGIPVMHDDQHGTAIVVLAGLLNAAKVVKKNLSDLKIVINGAGAAGVAIAKLLTCVHLDKNICERVADVIICDSKGIISRERKHLEEYKQQLIQMTNRRGVQGTLADALADADVFIGVSVAHALHPRMIKSMNRKPIIFALANPAPEIDPMLAKKAGATIIATGRSDYPNQVNNALAFPGVFRGLLDAEASCVTEKMKLQAAYALANLIRKPTADHILPSLFDKRIVPTIARAVRSVAHKK